MEKEETRIAVIDESIRDLALKDISDLIDKDNKFLQIFTRAADPDTKSLVEFHTIDENRLAKIAEGMPEINRACNVFGRQNSQATGKLMSLAMISQSPYRRLKQVLAKIERKRGALKENIFKLRREKIALNKLIKKRDAVKDKIKDASIEDLEKEDLYLDLESIQIDIEEKVSNISDSNIYIEGALKEIGMYQDAYNEIVKNYNIPEKWNEDDFEKMEVEEHVKTAFLHSLRDVQMTGRLNVGTMEYLEQFGVNPTIAFKLVQEYLTSVDKSGIVANEKGELIINADIDHLYRFLDEMYKVFGQEWKKAAKRIGIDDYISKDFLYTGALDKDVATEEKDGEEDIY